MAISFANDVEVLVITRAVRPTNPVAPTDAELEPLRWLAQLAVNIVDFIDEDEIGAPFNFYGTVDPQLSSVDPTLLLGSSTC